MNVPSSFQSNKFPDFVSFKSSNKIWHLLENLESGDPQKKHLSLAPREYAGI